MTDRKAGPHTRDKKTLPIFSGASEVWDDRLRTVGLTETEERILDGLASGRTGLQICQGLGISRTQYHHYLHALRRYLRVRTTTEAVALYVRLKSGL